MGTARPKIPYHKSKCKTWSSYIRLVDDDRKPLEWRQVRPYHWSWSIEQPKCTWKPERERYNGECVRLMHHWKSYEIYLWVRWPTRDEKVLLHSLCEMKQRQSTIFYRVLRNKHYFSINWAIVYRQGARHHYTELRCMARWSVHFIYNFYMWHLQEFSSNLVCPTTTPTTRPPRATSATIRDLLDRRFWYNILVQ